MEDDLTFLCDSEKVINHVIEKTTPIRPVAIFVYGPSGCGKTSILDKVYGNGNICSLISYWKTLIVAEDAFCESIDLISMVEQKDVKFTNYNLVPILHDEILSNFPSYKEIQKTFIEKLSRINSEDIKDYEDIANEYYEIYSKYRSYVYPITSNLTNACLVSRRNILIETTGCDVEYIEKMIKRIKGNGYFIVCLFPLVKLDAIFSRVIYRSKKCGRIISEEYLRKSYINSFDNFFKLTNKFDEAYMFDADKSFGRDFVIFHKKYNDYKVVRQITARSINNVIDYLLTQYKPTDMKFFRYKKQISGSRETDILSPTLDAS